MSHTVNDYIITKENNRYGLSLKTGEEITPCVYDEIRKENHYFHCRIWKNWDYVYYDNGEASISERVGGSPQGDHVTIEDLIFYDSIKTEECNGIFITYKNGRFGAVRKDYSVILQNDYDGVFKWADADVIATRKGDDIRYFDISANEILTGCKVKPVTIHSDNHCPIRELFSGERDDRVYHHNKIGNIRISVSSIQDCPKLFQTGKEIIPLSQTAFKNLLDTYSYEYGACILTLHLDDQLLVKGIKAIKDVGLMQNSEYFIDMFFTKATTHLKAINFVGLIRHYQDNERCLGNSPYVGYGIDDSVADDTVKWVHLEHYNEHCFPGNYKIGDLVASGTVEELRATVEGIDWNETHDTYGGPFFHLGNIGFTKRRKWKDTEKVLDYIASYYPETSQFLFYCVEALKPSEYNKITIERMRFYYRAISWALENHANPNEVIRKGKTPLDLLDSFNYPMLKPLASTIKEKIREILCKHGALSLKDLREEENKYYQTNPYNYERLIKRSVSQKAFKIGACNGGQLD